MPNPFWSSLVSFCVSRDPYYPTVVMYGVTTDPYEPNEWPKIYPPITVPKTPTPDEVKEQLKKLMGTLDKDAVRLLCDAIEKLWGDESPLSRTHKMYIRMIFEPLVKKVRVGL